MERENEEQNKKITEGEQDSIKQENFKTFT